MKSAERKPRVKLKGDRGLRYSTDIKDTYGHGTVHASDSSAACSLCFWLRVSGKLTPKSGPPWPEAEFGEIALHLSEKSVRQLIADLKELVDHADR